MIRRLLCYLSIHSLFEQDDQWGTALVCRYCTFALAEFDLGLLEEDAD